MKKTLILCLLLALLSNTFTFGQPQGAARRDPRLYRDADPVESTNLTKFNLDFPGGAPRQLITAIEKAMGKPVNAIVPPEHANVKLPPLKMANVDVAQLFRTLELMSQKTEPYITGMYQSSNPSYQMITTSFGFRSQSGSLSDDTIWYFYVVDVPKTPFDTPPVVPKVCRFYPLTSYLELGLTVDDITTAIQTGWKMLGDKESPAISFHKETKLLIAVGEPGKLETIDAVLQALRPAQNPGEAFQHRLNTILKSARPEIPPPLPANAEPQATRQLPSRTLRQPESSSTND